VPICDGCGADAQPQHIRQRIERLELATRFRPVHIQVLLIDAAPPPGFEDYFYQAVAEHPSRSLSSARYWDEVLGCAGLSPGSEAEESLLAEFQRRGFFLAYAAECPVEDVRLEETVRNRAETILKRVQYSYRPKKIALLSPQTGSLLPAFERCGWADRLLLDQGQPFAGADFGKGICEVIGSLG
jgi:hypothetical protein